MERIEMDEASIQRLIEGAIRDISPPTVSSPAGDPLVVMEESLHQPAGGLEGFLGEGGGGGTVHLFGTREEDDSPIDPENPDAVVGEGSPITPIRFKSAEGCSFRVKFSQDSEADGGIDGGILVEVGVYYK